jgi:hypothetical protein
MQEICSFPHTPPSSQYLLQVNESRRCNRQLASLSSRRREYTYGGGIPACPVKMISRDQISNLKFQIDFK